MNRTCRIVMLTLLLSALPLRGYAGVLMALCEGHHGGSAAAHEREDGHHHEAEEGSAGDPRHAASVCSVCASCCAGAGLASETRHGIAFRFPAALRIPFFDSRVSGFIPEHFDRPPLAL